MNRLTTLQQIKKCLNSVKELIGEVLSTTVDALSELQNKIPTKTSDLDNDAGFITSSVANTTYNLSKDGSNIKLIGSDGSESSVSDNDTIYSVATQDLSGLMSSSDKSKLDGIDKKANNYIHPEFHPPSIISQDGFNRFVTDEEKNKWNSALQDAKAYTDLFYQQSTGYTDQKIANLINGASSTMDTLGEIERAMTENHDVVETLHEAVGKKANQSEMDSLLATKLDKTGDSQNNTITFESGDSTNPTGWTDIVSITSGLTHSTLANRFTTAVKNLRYLWKLIGNANISGIGDGTISGALNSLNSNLSNKLRFYSQPLRKNLVANTSTNIQLDYIGQIMYFYVNTDDGINYTLPFVTNIYGRASVGSVYIDYRIENGKIIITSNVDCMLVGIYVLL